MLKQSGNLRYFSPCCSLTDQMWEVSWDANYGPAGQCVQKVFVIMRSSRFPYLLGTCISCEFDSQFFGGKKLHFGTELRWVCRVQTVEKWWHTGTVASWAQWATWSRESLISLETTLMMTGTGKLSNDLGIKACKKENTLPLPKTARTLTPRCTRDG